MKDTNGKNRLGIQMRNSRLILLLIGLMFFGGAWAQKPVVKKIFIFGDSMTGWMADRLEAYGQKNGFQVEALTWDGATIKKYANNSAALSRYIKKANPDAVFVCLGMNEMGTRDPERTVGASYTKLMKAIGDIPVIWIGPCTWPSKPANYGSGLNKWLQKKLGASHYYDSMKLKLARQSSTNPHPTRAGINTWITDVVKWIEAGNAAIQLSGYSAPTKDYVRPKAFTYRRMKAVI